MEVMEVDSVVNKRLPLVSLLWCVQVVFPLSLSFQNQLIFTLHGRNGLVIYAY